MAGAFAFGCTASVKSGAGTWLREGGLRCRQTAAGKRRGEAAQAASALPSGRRCLHRQGQTAALAAVLGFGAFARRLHCDLTDGARLRWRRLGIRGHGIVMPEPAGSGNPDVCGGWNRRVQVKRTPMRLDARQTTWQFRFTNSGLISSVKSSGMPTGLSTSRAAPLSDIFRMMQSMAAATPKMIEPPLKVRSRGLPRKSAMTMESIWLLPPMAIGGPGPRRDENSVYADYNLSSLERTIGVNVDSRS